MKKFEIEEKLKQQGDNLDSKIKNSEVNFFLSWKRNSELSTINLIIPYSTLSSPP